jgi:hypothetical protein
LKKELDTQESSIARDGRESEENNRKSGERFRIAKLHYSRRP